MSETVPPKKSLVHCIPEDINPTSYVAELLCRDPALIDFGFTDV